jgi:hypothetical protein
MQLIKILFSICIVMGFNHPVLANPPFQILQTCMKGEPYDDKIIIREIEGAGPADNSLDGCENQYDRIFQGKAFGTLTCNEKFYFIINDKKIDPEPSENFSINPEIKPGVEFTSSIWYKIEYENKLYLCIFHHFQSMA